MTVLRFGDYEFFTAVPELRRRGRRVRLQEVPLKLLETLLEQPQVLLTRERLCARLWPQDRTGLLDDNLNTAVRKLRLALGDSAQRPRYIETVPRRGYRFVAAVSREDAPRAAAGDTARVPRRPRFSRGGLLAGIAVAAALLAMTAALRGLPFLDGYRAEKGPQTLVVLPFDNAGEDPDDDYFSDGLTEELIDRLARATAFRMVSRTSAFAAKSTGIDAREIGRTLGADALVEGSVRRDGDRLRISARLIDAGNGYQLWSETFDRRMDDVFEVQQDIALAIATTLAGRLLAPAETAELEAPITDPVAYDLYLQGRFYWHRRTERDLRLAARHFNEAVNRAPDYAPAWAGLGDSYAVLGFYDYLPPAQAFPKARETALRALNLDPRSAAAESTLGYAALYYDWDFSAAQAHFRRALELRPGYSKAHQWYANLLTAAGRFDEAERQMRLAQQTDPLSLIANAALGWVRYHAGRHEEALQQYRLTLALDIDFELAYLWSGWAYEALGRYDEAFTALTEAVRRSDGRHQHRLPGQAAGASGGARIGCRASGRPGIHRPIPACL